MTESELKDFIQKRYPIEDEGCEWKEYSSLKRSVSGDEGNDIISYLSGISNMEGGVLIVGVRDKTGEIIGISDLYHRTKETIKHQLLNQTVNLPSDGLLIEEIITIDTCKTVWIFHIPRHQPRRIVYAHHRAWKRDGDSLVVMDTNREQAILNEPLTESYDWSADISTEATISDLDPQAILKAREMYTVKNPRIKQEIQTWNDLTFLNMARLTIKDKITNAAIILLGKDVSEVYLTSGLAQIYWVLKGKNNEDLDYQTFHCPMIQTVEEVFAKIRNIRYRYQNESTIFPEEMDRYESGLIREALHNCIAHQDYQQGGRITVVESEEGFLRFTNPGSFLPGNLETILYATTPPNIYRNPFLANAMVSLNMIDTLGGGIRRMFEAQRKRFFPMPEYDLSNNKVEVTIIGKVMDDAFARLLLRSIDLTINEIYLLDKVQKNKPIQPEEAKLLKAKGLIEGRRPRLYLSKPVSDITGHRIKYSRNKGLKREQYKALILQAIEEHGGLSRKDIDELLMDILPANLSAHQKSDLIHAYLTKLRKSGLIINTGSRKFPNWIKQ